MALQERGDTSPPDPAQRGGHLTTDIRLARYLLAAGHTPNVEPAGGGRCLFRFPHDDTLTEHVEAFLGGRALISPQAVEAARYRIRALIADAKQSAQAEG